MKIKDFKCSCGKDDFMLFVPNEGKHTGIYCTYCGKWLKWANKEEKRLMAGKVAEFKGGKT